MSSDRQRAMNAAELASIANSAEIRKTYTNKPKPKKESKMLKNYRKKNVQPMRPYIEGEDLTGVSVSDEDKKLDTLAGGMIAVSAANPEDK